MKIVYQIYGASYSGCEGWSEWPTKLVFEDQSKAKEIASEMSQKSSHTSYEAKAIELL